MVRGTPVSSDDNLLVTQRSIEGGNLLTVDIRAGIDRRRRVLAIADDHDRSRRMALRQLPQEFLEILCLVRLAGVGDQVCRVGSRRTDAIFVGPLPPEIGKM